jgi:predicted kinase
MGTIHLVLGPQGAGKSTYARKLAKQEHAVRFSIDEWMQQLFGPDVPKAMSLSWIMDRVQRCEAQIWAMATQVCMNNGSVILDLGFTKIESRRNFRALAATIDADVQLHVLEAPYAARKERVVNRNIEKGETYSFEVTPMMFDFMEKEFQHPTDEELEHAIIVEQQP